APATSHRKSNKPDGDASRSKQTVVNDTKKHASKQNIQKTDNTVLHSIGRVSSTNSSGSKSRSNTKNYRIPHPSCRSKKNKVEAHHRKFKSSANKNNHVSDCNANVKILLCQRILQMFAYLVMNVFFANHYACVVKYLNDVQKCKKAKSVKQKEKKPWKPTGRIFTSVGLRWKPTRRMFNMEGKIIQPSSPL
nr:hypothetical protein [Tanacetum cinerariifolium]